MNGTLTISVSSPAYDPFFVDGIDKCSDVLSEEYETFQIECRSPSLLYVTFTAHI